MENDFTHEAFVNFPPLYTEQINDTTLGKQLEIWWRIINKEVLSKGINTLGIGSVDSPPFKNDGIGRGVNVTFLALILEYLADRGIAFYLHPIEVFCTQNKCTVWGALFINKRYKESNLYQCSNLYSQKLKSSSAMEDKNDPQKSKDSQDIEKLKKRRDSIIESNYNFGIFSCTVRGMCEAVMECIKLQCTSRDIETVYHLFYNKSDWNEGLNNIPEPHLAFILSTLAYETKISISCNQSVSVNTLTNKQVGIQLI
ncbi:conserved hypothetical protein [Theileria equi strain WA]|uniref:ESCRT-II complex subunit VPS25 n=1 Tax=Theileria equi strain WA TaxID=1537102 RepID=L1LDJ7_THEEQ|nr:conserved hypothetical protein [Theileria equi strain WA]EKX73310.1 conserved hypothetical protein [Theileria equi strain WA]|eukprot:XP_004832762.1 conserved hypothetical protein [Theileria equi strain WA]